MTTTTIILESDDPAPVLIETLSVRVFDTGGVFVTSGDTNASGEAIFDLPDEDYDLYFYKKGVSINGGMPQRITVDAADPDVPPNTYRVIAHITSMPESVDPLLCTISGYIRGANGLPTLDGKLTFAPTLQTGVIGGDIISPQNLIHIHPDVSGYYEFQLLRNVCYHAYFHWLQSLLDVTPPELDVSRVPDLPALSISDLLFPVPVNGEFDPTDLDVAVGVDDDSVATVITYSDNSVRDTGSTLVAMSAVSDDEDVAVVSLLSGKVLVTGVAVGTANITLVRAISSNIYYSPAPTFTTDTLVVTVS